MKRLITLAVLFLLPVSAFAQKSVYVEHACGQLMTPQNTAVGTVIDDLAINTDRWTGWMKVGQYDAVCFDITFTRSAATGVEMYCEVSVNGSEANGAAAELMAHSVAYDATNHEMDITSATAHWVNPRGATQSWWWCVGDIPAPYVNCVIYDTASAGASDKVTAYACGVTQ